MVITQINGWWCSTDTYIGSSDTSNITQYQIDNATLFKSFMLLNGFSNEAICAILGNAQVESLLSPAFTETRRPTLQPNAEMLSYSRGLGLVQWTGFNADGDQKLVAYCDRHGWDWYDGNAQCNRLLAERDNNLQFQEVRVSGITYTWENFYNSTASVSDLTKAWCWGYERPSDPDMERRIANAEYWYQSGIAEPLEVWMLALFNKKKEMKRVWRKM